MIGIMDSMRQEIEQLKAENFKLKGELGSIRSGSAKVIRFKQAEISHLQKEITRLRGLVK